MKISDSEQCIPYWNMHCYRNWRFCSCCQCHSSSWDIAHLSHSSLILLILIQILSLAWKVGLNMDCHILRHSLCLRVEKYVKLSWWRCFTSLVLHKNYLGQKKSGGDCIQWWCKESTLKYLSKWNSRIVWSRCFRISDAIVSKWRIISFFQ